MDRIPDDYVKYGEKFFISSDSVGLDGNYFIPIVVIKSEGHTTYAKAVAINRNMGSIYLREYEKERIIPFTILSEVLYG